MDGEPYSGPKEVASGTAVTIHFEPSEGYVFTGWRGGGSEPDREVTVTENTTLTAETEEE